MKLFLISALMVSAPAVASAEPVLWAGHQVVHGKRDVPLVGDVATRTDSYFLAEVVKQADGSIALKQRTCKVEIAKTAGVKVSFPQASEPRLPAVDIVFRKQDDRYYAEFVSGWDSKDADGDGKPGATLLVDAPLCSGKLFVATAASTRLRGRETAGGLTGEARAVSDQKTLSAEGTCLRMMASDTRDAVGGTFAYVPVDAGATCESLLRNAWPARAPEPRR